MLDIGTLLRFYKQPEVQKAILKNAEGREVAIRFKEGGFGERPDILQYPNDILGAVKLGASSFHISEERWKNPLQLDPMLRKDELNKLRKGWDLIIDIDCPALEYSKIAAELIVKAIERHDIKSLSVKFSGNHGFHIGIPFEAFPGNVHGKETTHLFPEGPKNIAIYLTEMIRSPLAEEMLKKETIQDIIKKTGKQFKDIVKNKKFDPFEVLSIDTILISSRHLYRSVYSFNEKSGLVSIPIDKNRVLEFKKEYAHPEKATIGKHHFLEDLKPRANEARHLFIQAFDFIQSRKALEEEALANLDQKEFKGTETAIPEVFFPPCIKLALKGLEDGKKRSLFILVNFLTSLGWSYEDIEKRIKEWNKTNKEALRETIVVSQIRYHKQRKKKILPPNCNNQMYYTAINVCRPDNLCNRIKNPAQYAIRKAGDLNKEKTRLKKGKEKQ